MPIHCCVLPCAWRQQVNQLPHVPLWHIYTGLKLDLPKSLISNFQQFRSAIYMYFDLALIWEIFLSGHILLVTLISHTVVNLILRMQIKYNFNSDLTLDWIY